MSKPILYDAAETDFSHNGIGILSDCISCEVTEERNGEFELVMKYPASGIHFSSVTDRAIIKAKANQSNTMQLFRVYARSKPLNGIVTVSAEHISYDLSGIPVAPFSADDIVETMAGLLSNAVVDCPFEFWTDKQTVATFAATTPKSIRACFGGSEGSILDVYGGEFEFDNYTVRLYNKRGANRGVSIRYGKNLTAIKQDENCASVYTGVYPYWLDGNGENLTQLDEKIVNADGDYNFIRILPLDLSSYFEEQPTQDQLLSTAKNYMMENEIGVPSVSLTVSFAQLEQSEEYKGIAFLERVFLCDTVNVEFPLLNVSTTAEVTKIVYDVLLDRVKSATLGSVRANITDTVLKQQQNIEKVESPTYLQKATANATNWITSGKGYVTIKRDAGGQANEILIMDTPDIETAVNVWRWNSGGLGYSSTGYNGIYSTAITQDGQIVADFMNAGTLNANVIRSGILQSAVGDAFYLNLETGEMRLKIAGSNVVTENDLSIVGDEIDSQLSSVNGDIQAVTDELHSTANTLSKYFEFTSTGLTIKAGENDMELTLDNGLILFSKGGQQFGYWDGVNFHTGNIVVEVNERAQFGNFAYVPRTDGSLSFLKVGE